MRPGVEVEPRPSPREQLRERLGCQRLLRACGVQRGLAAPRSGLADPDERSRIARLDPGVRRPVQPRVDEGRDRLSLPVVLGGKEDPQVGLVPDAVELHGRETGVRAVVPIRDRAGEIGQILEVCRRDLLALPVVRPARRAPDRQHHGDSARRRIADELVQVGEAIGAVERVRGMRGALRRHSRPVHGRSHDGRIELLDAIERRGATVPPAQGRVVLEAHPHVVGGARGGRGGAGGEQAGEDQAKAKRHWQEHSFTGRDNNRGRGRSGT